jgi:hypothetical protein
MEKHESCSLDMIICLGSTNRRKWCYKRNGRKMVVTKIKSGKKQLISRIKWEKTK